MNPLATVRRLAKTYSPTRILGALRRRKTDWLRAMQYRPDRTTVLANAVLFETFQGKTIGDNPLDIYEAVKRARPDLTIYWTVITGKTTAPEGTIGLAHGSREWLQVLATAKYLVNNTNFPWYFRKVEGQVYLQTWHGTPLKRLGRDIENNNLTKSYLDTMDREASFWDYLISPSPFCTQIFPESFGYSGRILETGYPRNDRLVVQPEGLREAVRARLGVDAQTTLVMYAPTWRDFKRSATGNWQTVNYMGADTPMPDGTRLMFRGHTNTHAAHTDAVAGGAIDVTTYPDVAELYLAADVLITDYSSVMFDFTVTGKPVIFLAPDIARYESERGFYFDFRNEAPGPMCMTTDEVLHAMANLDAVRSDYATKYAAWRAKFNSLEDGHAAQRVTDIVFGQ
ncbi:CDP-glycerol glycerophosphotransferase [Microbacteriaceae bacterium MWH-Ta3]|nr:CDP-glycerol glycerophosphotransferase [Microbacteriaceae bacterium MWH-Ta3]